MDIHLNYCKSNTHNFKQFNKKVNKILKQIDELSNKHYHFFFKERDAFKLNVLIPQGHISLIKSDSKYNYDVTKYVFWMFYSSKNPENIYVSKKMLFLTLMIIRNVSWAGKSAELEWF